MRKFTCVLLSGLVGVASSFSPLLAATVRQLRSPDLTNTGSPFKFDRLRLARQQSDVVLYELEQTLEKLSRQRQKVIDELDHYDASLKKLRNDRIDYLMVSQRATSPQLIEDPKPRQVIGYTAESSFSETAIRSAVKAICWRVLAESVTYSLAMKFSGSSSVAIKLVGVTFLLKAGIMFLGERIMNKSAFGRRSNGSEGVSRSFAKALFWRMLAISNMLVMALFVSKDYSIASKIASTDAVFKTALMFAYDRIWANVQWGKESVSTA